MEKRETERKIPMTCKNCQSYLEDDARFCPNCGAAVTPEQEEPVEGREPNAGQGPAVGHTAPPAGQVPPPVGQGPAMGQPPAGYQPPVGYQQPGNYQQQPQYYQPPMGYPQGGPPPVNQTPYLVCSILATLFCCLPLGIVGIVYASKINSFLAIGNLIGAQEAAKKSKLFIILGAILGFVCIIAYFAFSFTLIGHYGYYY